MAHLVGQKYKSGADRLQRRTDMKMRDNSAQLREMKRRQKTQAAQAQIPSIQHHTMLLYPR